LIRRGPQAKERKSRFGGPILINTKLPDVEEEIVGHREGHRMNIPYAGSKRSPGSFLPVSIDGLLF